MADPILHIKDSYYFEVPKWLWRADYQSYDDFRDGAEVWFRLDPEFQIWEAEQVYLNLKNDYQNRATIPSWEEFKHDYLHWTHEAGNHGKPVRRFLNELAAEIDEQGELVHNWAKPWASAQADVDIKEYTPVNGEWDSTKIEGYNRALDGKILIPQPLGSLRNLYQADAGLCISKFMIIEMFVALVMVVLFTGLARHISGGKLARGRFWNLIDVFVTYLRNNVIKPGIGHGADKFVPMLWTMFFFVLGCNLLGLVPWVGSPTGSFSVTLALALSTLVIGMGAATVKFGPVGAWLNLIPGMDLPFPIGLIVKPMLFVIEIVGLFIKHAVLGIRLLANMVAGHLVLLGIMGVVTAQDVATSSSWYIAFPIVIVGCIAFSCLELFVAFLQAYIFTFLSSLFIGSSTHHH